MNIVIVPSLKSELLSSTALTPTQHKGGIGSIIGIVAAIAIPFAAPAIAASIGLSSAIGATLASGLVGAALGAATAAITGGNIAMGAIGGGIGGGIAGFNAPVGTPGTGIASTGGLGEFGGLTAAQSGAVPSSTGLVTAGADAFPGGIQTAGGIVDTGAAGYSGGSFVNAPGGFTGSAPVNSAGGVLSGGSGEATLEGMVGFDTLGEVQGGPGSLSQSGAAPAAVTPSPPAGGQPSFFDNLSSGVNKLGDKISGFAEGLPDKIFSSEAAQQVAGKALTQGIGNFMAGDEADMTPFESAQMAQLQAARAREGELLAKRQKVSDSYVQQAASVNPVYYGQQALTDEQNRLNRAQQAGLRKLPTNSGARDAQVRRNALDKSRLSGFDRGRQAADTKRLQLMRAAQGSAPTGSAYADNIAKDITQYDKLYAPRHAKEVENYGNMFKPITKEIFSLDSEAERKRKAEAASGR